MANFDKYFKGLEEALNLGFSIKVESDIGEVYTSVEKNNKQGEAIELIATGNQSTLLHSLIEASISIDGRGYDDYKNELANFGGSLFKYITEKKQIDYALEQGYNLNFYKLKEDRIISSIESPKNGIIKAFISEDIITNINHINLFLQRNDLVNLENYDDINKRITDLKEIMSELTKIDNLAMDAIKGYYNDISWVNAINNTNESIPVFDDMSLINAIRESNKKVAEIPVYDFSGVRRID